VKFLIDRCAGHRLAQWLQTQGHDVLESRDRGPDPGDRILLDWALAEGRILITMDKDFGAFIFVDDAQHCGIIRLPDVPVEKRIKLMEKVLATHSADLANQAIITVRGARIRVSRAS
jgi:predicted nuclease of predicted toxin-antitoxin system